MEDALTIASHSHPAVEGHPESLDNAAYVIHTSGSTGRPKAVEISHRAFVNLLESMREKPGFSASDTLLAITTVSFDIAGLELFLPLISGGKVVIASRSVALDPYLLASAIEESACTVLQATPATWRGLLSTGWRGKLGMRVLCGGEVLTRDLADRLLALRLELWNMYGPTETTIWSTVHRVTEGKGPIAIGQPIANTRTYILDQQKQPVPIGVVGELHIGGLGLANGYRGQPQLSSDKFVARPTVTEARIYRTGDQALYRGDGSIEIQGRIDNQVKIRGYRIELEDIEASLSAHPGVAAAAAKVWPNLSGDNRIIAYLVGKQSPPPNAFELREFLRSRVPDYMIPSDVVALKEMPLTANSKMDRKALPAPTFNNDRHISAAPCTEAEQQLAAIWTDLLGITSVSLDDNFFDLGGHSLLVARLQQRIFTAFGSKLAMAAIFHAPTIASQIRLLTEKSMNDRSRLIPIKVNGTRPPLFWLQPPPRIRNLAAYLEEDQPLLGVTLTLDDIGPSVSESTIEKFARCCLETILSAQPSGPYYLGGLCTSGILAYEVAAQLTRAGHTVASLVMLDAENPIFYRRLDTLSIEFAKLSYYGHRALRRRGTKMFFRHVNSRLKRLLRLEEASPTEMSAIEAAILAAAFRYRPSNYLGDVLLLLAKDRPALVDYLSGWQVVVSGRLTCKDVVGHHDELLDPENAAGVARTLTTHLASI